MQEAVRRIFEQLDPPVWIVTAAHDDRSGGLVATFVMKASIVDDEPRVILGLARHHFTHELIDGAGQLALHLLRPNQSQLALHFGLQSGRHTSKLQGVAHEMSSGVPLLPDCAARLTGSVEARFNTGDRTLFMCRITSAEPIVPGPVLTMSRLLNVMSDEQRQTLKTQLQADADMDREAIQKWRAERREQ